MWQGNKGFSLWDEGYLWYGVQRVMLGEVPLRDFMSYDPGRYYWSATLMKLWGDNGIMALRSAVAVFQALGLFVGLMLITRVAKKNVLYVLLSTIVLLAWMFPRHKLFDISLSIFSISTLTMLIQNPTSRRYFGAGMYAGLAAVFGRNHGMYCVVASIGAIIWLNIKCTSGPSLVKGCVIWVAGVITGYTPMLFMILLVQGFAVSFWDSILFLFEIKATNLPLPIPWPWLVNFNLLSLCDSIYHVLVGFFFIAIIIYGTVAIIWTVWKKVEDKDISPVLVATAFLALPYAHVAYSRADVSHLAQGIFPFLIACLTFLAMQPAKLKWPLIILLCGASITVWKYNGWQCGGNERCTEIKVSSSLLEVNADTANAIALLRMLAAQYAPDGQSFIVTPFWPGAYALLERRSPLWEIYALFPRSKTFEHTEIERIKTARPAFVMILDHSIDGRDELRFRNTHPLTYQYIINNFERLPGTLNPAYHIYKRKENHSP